jgi:hypothetical protein
MPSGKSDRRRERQLMNMVAGYVRKAIEHYKKAARCKKGSKAERSALKQAENFWGIAGVIICNMVDLSALNKPKESANPARVLRRVGLALENKLPTNTGWRDAEIVAAVSAVRSSNVYKPFRKIKAKFIEMFGEKNLPDDSSFRRSLERLGYLNVKGAPGRPTETVTDS